MRAATRGVVAELRAVADPSRRPGMTRVGINVDRALGVSIPDLRRLGRRHGSDHALALDLWRSGIHEARILASMIDDPGQVTRDQMEAWALDFDSDRTFTAWFPAIRRGATDDRNYVKKAVSWALRQIGKRNLALNAAAIGEAETLSMSDVPSARWVGRDALRELRLDDTQRRLRAG